jgi:hypothetical protein
MAVVNAAMLFIGVLPYRLTDGAKNQNDGAAILQLLFPRWSAIQTDPATRRPEDQDVPGPSWRWIRIHLPPEKLLANYKARLNDPTLSVQTRCQYMDAFATAVLFYGATSFLPEASQYSDELTQTVPEAWTVKGTRGSILIDRGDIEAGTVILEDVVKHDPSPIDRGIAASFLAMAEFKRNHPDAALEWIGLARRLDPNCGALPRMESILSRPPGIDSRAVSHYCQTI